MGACFRLVFTDGADHNIMRPSGIFRATVFTVVLAAMLNVSGSAADPSPRLDLGRSAFRLLSVGATNNVPPDNTPPSIPGTPIVVAATAGKVVISWTASTDDSGQVAYNVERDNSLIAIGHVAPVYTDLRVAPGSTYSYRVQAIDAAGNPSGFSAAATATTPASSAVETNGLILEIWTNLTGSAVVDLLNSPEYQTNAPDFQILASAADSRTGYPSGTAQNYGGRMTGLLTPAESGLYQLFLRSQDASRLYLSPDEDLANIVPVAEERACCGAFEETGDPRTSAPVALLANRRYALQVLWKAGEAGGYAQVAWRRVGDLTPASALAPISGEFLRAVWDPTVGPPLFSQRTTEFGGVGSNAVFTVTVGGGDSAMSFQWSTGGASLENATNTTLVLTNVALTNFGRVYTVTAENVFGTASADFVTLPRGTLFVEAEDFNFGGGQYITNQPIGMTGRYSGGAFTGRGTVADANIDWSVNEAVGQAGRFPGGPGVTTTNVPSESFVRGEFDVQVNALVVGADPGEWLNYTREFPAPGQDYYVLGRFSSTNAPIHVRMDEVTAGSTTTNQTLLSLGEFRPTRASAPADAWEAFPLLSTAGQPVVLTNLTGLKTFRMTVLTNGGGEMDYFMFVPVVVPSGGGGTNTNVQITRSGNNLVLTWSTGRLESADNVSGPWTAVPTASSPFTIPPAGTRKFYRVR
jgi:hypothetical protein